jgi:hypothetical protein
LSFAQKHKENAEKGLGGMWREEMGKMEGMGSDGSFFILLY